MSVESSNPKYFPLTDLPLEILCQIYAVSLNPSLLQVNHKLCYSLNTSYGRLQFALKALNPQIRLHTSARYAAELQNWLLRRSWFDNDIARNIERVLSHDARSDGDTLMAELKITDEVHTSSKRRPELHRRIQLTQHVYLPGRLLKGPWTDDQVHLLKRLVRWGATIISTPPCHRVPNTVLSNAVVEGNLRAIDFFRFDLEIPFDQAMLRRAVLQDNDKEVLTLIFLDSVLNDEPWVDWDDETLWACAREQAKQENSADQWLMSALSSSGSSVLDERMKKPRKPKTF